EWTEMKNHPLYGYKIIGKVPSLKNISEIVMHHHERWDGKGYPSGLSGCRIPIGARIIAIADSIDAMLSDRSYRKAISTDLCKKEISNNIGAMYDPYIAEMVIKNWDKVIAKQQCVSTTPYI
ncbi:MAG: HD domain-containing phosphohydrolase, partial [Oscillospiraceae bacterium]